MADITKCNGGGCKPRGSCKRFTAASSARQSYAGFDYHRRELVGLGLIPQHKPCEFYIPNERPFTDHQKRGSDSSYV